MLGISGYYFTKVSYFVDNFESSLLCCGSMVMVIFDKYVLLYGDCGGFLIRMHIPKYPGDVLGKIKFKSVNFRFSVCLWCLGVKRVLRERVAA